MSTTLDLSFFVWVYADGSMSKVSSLGRSWDTELANIRVMYDALVDLPKLFVGYTKSGDQMLIVWR